MEARIKANKKIIKGRLAEILVKKGRAIDLKVEEKVKKLNEARAAKAAEKQKQPVKQAKKPVNK